MRKLLLVTDAWTPQTNGVVTTWQQVLAQLKVLGCDSTVVHPGGFRTAPLPTYPEIRLALNPQRLKTIFDEFAPDAAHIATEGTLGLYARRLFVRRGIPYTTSLHTKFPEYVNERIKLPLSVGYRFVRWFHRPAVRTLCRTESQKRELEAWGLTDLVVWSGGVDVQRFQPAERTPRERPRLLFVGRVAVEKNIEAFLALDMDADKVVVGDGPQRAELQNRYPDVHWLGFRRGEELVAEYAQADVFVFPSLTDTFGLVLLEANACGTPVAAFPVTGPVDVVHQGVSGALHENLGEAVRQALTLDRGRCREHAMGYGWPRAAESLLTHLEPFSA